MTRRKYGPGMAHEDFDSMCDSLSASLLKITAVWFDKTLDLLLRHAPMLAKCSKRQFVELRRVLSVGRVQQVTDLLDKVQCYGMGLLPDHIVKNTGITADTFLSLSAKDKKILTDGEVLLKDRNDVLRIRAAKLNAKQMAKVVRSSKCSEGAKILSPDEQNIPRQRKNPKYYVPLSYNVDGDTVVVTCEQGRSISRVRFCAADVVNLTRMMESTKKCRTA